MLTAFVRAFQTPDLRKKMLVTLGPDRAVPVRCLAADARHRREERGLLLQPGHQRRQLHGGRAGHRQPAVSGQALLRLSVFALGIMPYITASIILQLLTVVIPRLETLKQEGQSGQAKITQYTRYLTVGLAVLQSTGYIELARSGTLFNGCGASGRQPADPERRDLQHRHHGDLHGRRHHGHHVDG